MEETSVMSAKEFEERMGSVINANIDDHPLTALHLGIGLVTYVLRQHGYTAGADIFQNAFIKKEEKEK